MTILNKVFHLDSQFTKELPSADEKIDSIFISGYASVNSVDRAGDVIPASVWESGLKNYLANPIVLAFHDHDDPIGRMIEHKVDKKGLWIKARVSAAAEIFNLIKDGVLTAFSVGFRVLDAEYNAETELFVITELELIEISVVSVPCNQDTIFSLSKSFENEDDYKNFKLQFAPKSESAKGLESSKEAGSTTLKEIGMDPKELEQMLASAAEKAAANATKAILAAQEKAAADAAAKAAEEAAMQDRINKAVAAVTPSTTGAEKLLEEVTKRIEAVETAGKKSLADLETALNEKAAELAAIQKSKMTFAEGKSDEISYEDKEKAVILSKMMGKSIEGTKFGRELLAKAEVGGKNPSHMASTTWELEVSFNMENEIRRKLVVAPLLRNIAMQTNVMTIPVNPEAGLGTWVTNTQFGTTASPGATVTHQLKEITLNAYKLATTEYLMYEEQEDSLITLLPIVRDAMVRRIARSLDKAFSIGVGSGADPVKGLGMYDATSTLTVTGTGAVTVANMRTLRKNLGVWGLEPDNVAFLVCNDVYYDLLDSTDFLTMDKVGAKATLLTGQIGAIGNSPVIVCSSLANKATGGTTSAATNIGVIAFATSNFIVGNQRGLRFDTQDLVETQRKVMVASLRTGMTQISTVDGPAVDSLRWT